MRHRSRCSLRGWCRPVCSFFFQAEGGIRGLYVTGVQTCALPILRLEEALGEVIAAHVPAEAAVEEVFLNENPQSTLKLGQARGVILFAAARRGLPVAE